MRKLLEWWASRLRIRPIYHEGGLYLKRYYICTLFGWRVYLHHFMMSDPDGRHNHPFPYSFSLILAGYYFEETRWGVKKKRLFNFIGPDKFHRVLVPQKSSGHYIAADDWSTEYRTCWSIFVHGPRTCHWAFLRRLPKKNWLEMSTPEQAKSDDPYNTTMFQDTYALYTLAGPDNPAPLSTWMFNAPRGKVWEAWTDAQKKDWMDYLREQANYEKRVATTKDR